MKAVAREGDLASHPPSWIPTPPEDIVPPPTTATPPPLEEGEVRPSGPYYGPGNEPKFKWKELIEAEAQRDSCAVFVNGKMILTAESKFCDAQLNEYERKWTLDDKGYMTGAYTDELINTQTVSNIKCICGSAGVFVNGVPVARKGDKLSVGKIETGSPDVFTA